jgi:hypothetical protein
MYFFRLARCPPRLHESDGAKLLVCTFIGEGYGKLARDDVLEPDWIS